MRNNPTKAENHLWYVLRAKNLGVKFRRQAIIGRYIVDFVCFQKKLIIEVDGGQHGENHGDLIRDEWFKEKGFRILRYWNNEVLINREGVISTIKENLKSPPSLTLPTKRGRESS